MTFELLEAIIVKNKIPKNVCLVNDSENDLRTTDMNGIQYCEKRNEICFMEGECHIITRSCRKGALEIIVACL